MNTSIDFYLCPNCFYASDFPDDSHEHALLRVRPGLPGDERRKPIIDRSGRILSAAPLCLVSGSHHPSQGGSAQHLMPIS